ncbi:MAG: DJ-1/PfpI family protein [Deltaproteobacteria bacterium]|nr:DJ-1/PfpI family protein [Deltaproteobacteria bacterium]
MNSEKRVLVPLAEGSEELEAIAIVDILRRAKARVEIVGIGGKILTCSKGVRIIADMPIEEVTTDLHYDAIIIPGGMPGSENIRDCKAFIDILQVNAKRGALIGAICAAPAVVLDYHGMTKEKKVTCHPAFSHLLKHGIYEPQAIVVDSNLVTGKSAGYAIDFALKIMEILCPDDIKKDVILGLSIH